MASRRSEFHRWEHESSTSMPSYNQQHDIALQLRQAPSRRNGDDISTRYRDDMQAVREPTGFSPGDQTGTQRRGLNGFEAFCSAPVNAYSGERSLDESDERLQFAHAPYYRSGCEMTQSTTTPISQRVPSIYAQQLEEGSRASEPLFFDSTSGPSSLERRLGRFHAGAQRGDVRRADEHAYMPHHGSPDFEEMENQSHSLLEAQMEESFDVPLLQDAASRADEARRAENSRESSMDVPLCRDESVPVSRLPPPFREIFSFTYFNPVQSVVFSEAFETDNDIVVTAPTGAGKTVIFELVVLRMLQESKDAKAVYLAPTKALCSERATDWAERFDRIGCRVAEMTGDANPRFEEMNEARLIVATPEKMDAISRRARRDDPILSRIDVLLVDEIHLLREKERGACLEVLIARLKFMKAAMRCVAVSATIPNADDVAEWIGRRNESPNTKLEPFVFSEAFRPCALEKHVCGYKAQRSEQWAHEHALLSLLPDIVKKYSNSRPTLIFCGTRKAAASTAKHLYQKTSNAGESAREADLEEMMRRGVAYHHAGLQISQRKAVESAFLRGEIDILCCTSSLAVGINLPAYLVVIRGTRLMAGEVRNYTDLEVLQMIGRAGRPQFEDKGICVIMTEESEVQRWTQLVQGQTVIESMLQHNLAEHVNAEICLRPGCTTHDIERWLQCTFFYVRLGKRADRHIISGCKPNCTPAEAAAAISHRIIEELGKHHLVDGYDPMLDRRPLTHSPFGMTMSLHCIRFETMKRLLHTDKGLSIDALITLFSEADEFKVFFLRHGEAAVYDKINQSGLMRCPVDKVEHGPHKVKILLQAKLAGIDALDFFKEDGGALHVNPIFEIQEILRWAPRIFRAILAIALERGDKATALNAFELARCSNGAAWDSSAATLTQIKDIGSHYIKGFERAGIRSISDLAHSGSERVQMLLNRQSSFADKIIREAKHFPALTIVGKELDFRPEQNGVRTTFELSVELANPKRSWNRLRMRQEDGRLLYVGILIMTSNETLCQYRRQPLQNLLKGESHTNMRLDAILQSPLDQVEVVAACEELSGTAVSFRLQSACPDSHYSLLSGRESASRQTSRPPSQNSQLSRSVEVALSTSSASLHDTGVQKSQPAASKPRDVSQILQEINAVASIDRHIIEDPSEKITRKRKKKEKARGQSSAGSKLLQDTIARAKTQLNAESTRQGTTCTRTASAVIEPKAASALGAKLSSTESNDSSSSLPDILDGWKQGRSGKSHLQRTPLSPASTAKEDNETTAAHITHTTQHYGESSTSQCMYSGEGSGSRPCHDDSLTKPLEPNGMAGVSAAAQLDAFASFALQEQKHDSNSPTASSPELFRGLPSFDSARAAQEKEGTGSSHSLALDLFSDFPSPLVEVASPTDIFDHGIDGVRDAMHYEGQPCAPETSLVTSLETPRYKSSKEDTHPNDYSFTASQLDDLYRFDDV